MIGETISHYKVLEKLGEGGMGVVYRARDTKLDRDVALKFLPETVDAGSGDMERFLQEAKAAAALNHPNICTVYGIEEADGKHFIAMEFVDGQSLLERKASLNPKQTLDAAVQVAEGLAAAHEKGIVHRDIKPENVMIRRDGRVQIMDFGLAKLRGASRLTREGSTVGTVGYMSPEQVQGQDTDHRTDIFSLGVILYELFAGQSPFKGVHETAIIYEIVNVETPPIAPVRPDIDPELERLILECLEKDPQDRCQSAAELARNLKRLKRESSKSRITSRVQAAVPAGASAKEEARKTLGRWKTTAIALSVVSVAAIAAAAFFSSTSEKASDLASYIYTPFEVTGDATGGRWSPDGNSITYWRRVDGESELMVRALDNPRSTKLLTTKSHRYSAWSPDGQRILFVSGRKLLSIGLTGGEPGTVLPNRMWTYAQSPEGKIIAFWTPAISVDSAYGDSMTVFFTAPDGGTPKRYTGDIFKTISHGNPAYMHFSPDGSKIALTFWGEEGPEFWILPWPDGGSDRPRRIFRNMGPSGVPFFAWLPDSRRVIMSRLGGVWVGDTDDERLRRVTSSPQGEYFSSVSPDGKRILIGVSNTNYDIVGLPLDGAPLKRIKSTSVDEWSSTVSSDGSSMAYLTNRSGKSEVWLEERGGAGHPIVTNKDFPADDSGEISVAILSPDGKRVAYHKPGKQALRTLWISNAEGGKPVQLFPASSWVMNPCWSPDGTRLYVSVTFGDSSHRMIIPIGSGDTVHLPDSAWSTGLPAWSPDGKWIALKQWGNRDGTRKDRLLLISPDGKQSRQIEVSVKPSAWQYCMTWSRDSRTIYIASSVDKTSRLDVVDVAAGTMRKIADYGYSVRFGQGSSQMSTASLSPAGDALVVSATFPTSDLYILDGALESEK